MQLLVSKSDAASQEAHRKLYRRLCRHNASTSKDGGVGVYSLFLFRGQNSECDGVVSILYLRVQLHICPSVAQQLGAKITVCPAALSQKIAA